jgi:hypothetical protein
MPTLAAVCCAPPRLPAAPVVRLGVVVLGLALVLGVLGVLAAAPLSEPSSAALAPHAIKLLSNMTRDSPHATR